MRGSFVRLDIEVGVVFGDSDSSETLAARSESARRGVSRYFRHHERLLHTDPAGSSRTDLGGLRDDAGCSRVSGFGRTRTETAAATGAGGTKVPTLLSLSYCAHAIGSTGRGFDLLRATLAQLTSLRAQITTNIIRLQNKSVNLTVSMTIMRKKARMHTLINRFFLQKSVLCCQASHKTDEYAQLLPLVPHSNAPTLLSRSTTLQLWSYSNALPLLPRSNVRAMVLRSRALPRLPRSNAVAH